MLVWRRHPLRPLEAVSASLVHRVRRYCAGAFIISTFDAIIWQRSETFFLGRYSTVDQIGYYGLAYSISGVLATMLPFAASGVLMPALSHQFGAGERDTMQRTYAAATKYVVILGLPFCLGGIAVAKPAIELIYGGGYAPAVWPLQILLVSGAVVAMAGPTSALFLALGKPYLAGLWGIPIALLNLMLGYSLAGPYGAVGAALANSICQVLGVAAGITYLSHFQQFRLPVGALLRTTMAASLGAGLTYLIVTLLAGWAGLVAAVTASAIVYIPALLLAGALDSSDFAVLRGLTSALPLRSGHVTRRLVDVTEAANLRLREVLHTRTR